MEVKALNIKTTFKCEKCEFKCDKLISLKKHSNTKRVDNNKSNNGKFYCYECPIEFKNKKSLKKNKEKEHKDSNEENSGNVNLYSEDKDASLCTADCDCNTCVAEWVYWAKAATKLNHTQ